jgi:hypothetical protein
MLSGTGAPPGGPSIAAAMFQWDEECKLGSIGNRNLSDISTQLFCKRGNYPHSQSFAFGEVKLGRQPDPVIAHRNRMVPTFCRTTRTPMRLSERPEKACLAAFETSSFTIKAIGMARSGWSRIPGVASTSSLQCGVPLTASAHTSRKYALRSMLSTSAS